MKRLDLVFSGIVVSMLAAATLLTPFLAVHPPEQQFRQLPNQPPIWAQSVPGSDPVEGPAASAPVSFKVWGRGFEYSLFGLRSDRHLLVSTDPTRPLLLLGSDALGRDLWSRTLYAVRFSLAAGLAGALLTILAGLAAGCLAGYGGRWLDSGLMRLCDLLLALPGLFLILGLRAVFPTRMDSFTVFGLVVLVFVLIGWGSVTRVVRGQVAAVKEMPHVAAARVIGASDLRILTRHILPFLKGYLAVQFLVLLPLFMLGEITMSFLGVGVQEPDVSLGTMLGGASSLASLSLYPWQILVPGLAILLPALALNLLGDRLKGTDAELPARWW